jgi:hypothetical protein
VRVLWRASWRRLDRAARVAQTEATPEEITMGIDKQSDLSANIQIGPTDQGMVRIYIEADDGTEIPMDFDPDEALDIAEELRAAAEAARAMGQSPDPKKKR